MAGRTAVVIMNSNDRKEKYTRGYGFAPRARDPHDELLRGTFFEVLNSEAVEIPAQSAKGTTATRQRPCEKLTHHPAFIPLFCSSSHFFNGAKDSRIAPASA